MTNTKAGWFANWDKDSEAFQPVLQTKSGIFTSLETWFPEEDQCESFIRSEVIGAGLHKESSGGTHE